MATIHVDGKEYEVDGSDNLLHACLSLGLNIPYFCWHPALGSVGACRQCAVKQFKDADDTRGRLVMSCLTSATTGTYISITDPEAVAFRASVDEFLMANHPHDCPVCEEGGHCHLQDMTVMTGHSLRRYHFTKRTHLNQDLGPFINHEMNRCIACYRCDRFYREYAGGTDFGVFGAHDNVYFGRPTPGTLENEFSGNLTEVCPTGVFTDKTHSERYVRKWDMQYAPSVCMHCSLGCNVSPGERYGEIRRIENRYNGTINHYFLCDRGRFGYGYTNRKDRPRVAFIAQDGKLAQASTEDARARLGGLLRGAKHVVGIGSPRASLESNFALRELVGAENFFDGHSDAEHVLVAQAIAILRDGPVASTTLKALESGDAALVLGEDVMQTAPRAALSLRQAARGLGQKLLAQQKLQHWQAGALENLAQDHYNPIFVTATHATRLDPIATETCRAAVEDQARLGLAVAHFIDPAAPAVAGLDAATEARAQRIAECLLAAERPLVVSGTGAGSAEILQAAANVAWALHARGKTVGFFLAFPEANSFGLGLMDARPLGEALDALANGAAEVAIVVENDLFRRAPTARVEAALDKARLVVVDHQDTPTTRHAEVLLPAATVFEGDGTVVNNEGRAQRYFQVFDTAYYHPDIATTESWRWLRRLLSDVRGDGHDASTFDEVSSACAAVLPQFTAITKAAPQAKFRILGLKAARTPHRYSGRTAMRANLSVHEPRASQDADSPLAFSMEGFNGTGTDNTPADQRPGALVSYAWAPGWNSPQAWNKFQDEVGGHLRGGDPGVHLFTANTQASTTYFTHIPAAFVVDNTTPRVVALPQIFGSELLSSRAEPVASRITEAYVAMNGTLAATLSLAEHDSVAVTIAGSVLSLPVRISDALPDGIIGVPDGAPGIPRIATGAQATLKVGAAA
ncbi:MAG: NADH-quinone oxidoreductase subunit NuoG [Nevskiaceae bacterium]|nr:MAG: NADH-quinone oxidoreductase subunit NuoG [Nevskiaceae bacterium]TBR73929.1 MAG: NADH-quinone oxidoreductase subunit NuoG [Nevskiaceae bacterium]